MDVYKIIMLADDDYLTVKMDSVSVIGTDGIDDYNELENIPKINNVEVKGSKSLADYDIESASEAKKEFENLNSEINTHEKKCRYARITYRQDEVGQWYDVYY